MLAVDFTGLSSTSRASTACARHGFMIPALRRRIQHPALIPSTWSCGAIAERTSSACLHIAISRPSSQVARVSAWQPGQVVLGVDCMAPINCRGHARFARMKSRTMFAKPVDVSDAPQRMAGRRWEGKLALPPLLDQASTSAHQTACSTARAESCIHGICPPLTAVDRPTYRLFWRPRSLVRHRKSVWASARRPERAPVATFGAEEVSYERPKRSDRL